MNARRIVRRLVRKLKDPALIDFIGRGRPRATGATGPHVLVATAGNGNIGDDAMVESFLRNTDGPVTIVCRDASAFPRIDTDGRATFLELPWLVQHGYFPPSLIDAIRFVRVLRDARSVSVVGADIMDGGYVWQNSVVRSNMARWAATRGIDARILGFSWSTAAHPRAAKAITDAHTAGVALFARDPQSQKRLEALVGSSLPASADVVFSDDRIADGHPLGGEFSRDDRPYVLLNISGLVAKRGVNQVSVALDVMNDLNDSGYRVVLLPHVVREGSGGDLDIARQIWAEVPDALRHSVTFVERVLRPDEVRLLARSAAFVATGRMHLSIIGLSQGRPAVVVSTQGKVDGLMQRFDIADLMVTPESIETGGLRTAVQCLESNLDDYVRHVRDALPAVTELSARNFAGLGG